MRPPTPAGYEVPLHRSLTEPVLIAGAPRSFTILNGTLAAAIGREIKLKGKHARFKKTDRGLFAATAAPTKQK